MQCNICGEEVDNSEELAKHMEKMHAIEEQEPEEASKPPAEEDAPPPPMVPPRM
ncbi:MAG TPA: hypothetical protein VGA76_00710 [Candidatus Dormibacteraeota bacterium]